jgi:hypothetical protein
VQLGPKWTRHAPVAVVVARLSWPLSGPFSPIFALAGGPCGRVGAPLSPTRLSHGGSRGETPLAGRGMSARPRVARALGTMKMGCTYASYAKSFLWVALLMAVAIGVAIIIELAFVDFAHGNPHRTQVNATEMMLLFPPIIGLIAIIGTFLVFALPQCFQAILADVLVRRFNRRGLVGVLLALPLTAGLTWYSFEYFTPTDLNLGINASPAWAPYQHGLTMQRFLATLAFQTPITLFNLWHCDTTIRVRSKNSIIMAALLLAVVVGVIWGYRMAQEQYQFL